MPYAGKQGEKIMRKIARKMPEEVQLRIIYKGARLSTFFFVKDKVRKEHCSNLIYYFKRKADENAYNGETKVQLGKRMEEHQGGEKIRR